MASTGAPSGTTFPYGIGGTGSAVPQGPQTAQAPVMPTIPSPTGSGRFQPLGSPFLSSSNGNTHNARRMTIEHTLRNGASLEVPTMELISKLTEASKKKSVKARLGTKAAKNYERLESAGDELEGEAATMFRASAKRYLYLSMDRTECAFSAKGLCRLSACPTKIGVEALKRGVHGGAWGLHGMINFELL